MPTQRMTVTMTVDVQVPEGLNAKEADLVARSRLVDGKRNFVLVGPQGPWRVDRVIEAY